MRRPIQQEHYGALVWVNTKIDALRGSECLCLHCGGRRECGTAAQLLRLCCDHELALAVTRCPDWSKR